MKVGVQWLRLLLQTTIMLTLDFTRAAESNCREPLGMKSGAIPDDAIKASSSYDDASVGPQNGRVDTERSGGAWCPMRPLNRDTYEWIQVDFGGYRFITYVETQGRFGNGQGQEYAEWYKLEYQRANDGPWIHFHNHSGSDLFKGNVNTYKPELRPIHPPIVAQKIRVVPYSEHERTLCMRIEFYGCKTLKDGVISYQIPEGDRRGSEVDLYDFTFDGVKNDGILSGGLGQLVDGELGDSNFRLDTGYSGRKGYEWIGWKNDSENRPPVELIFEFDTVRNFTSVRIHSNNLFDKDVRVFRMAEVYFSISGYLYQEEPERFFYMRDSLMQYSRMVIIHIPHRLGRFVKILLYFDDRWMMISEVQFESEPADGNYTDELILQPPYKHSHVNKTDELMHHPAYSGGPSTTLKDESFYEDGGVEPPNQSLDDQYIGIIIGALAAFILLLTGIVLLITIRKRKLKSNNNSKHTESEPHHLMLDLNDLRVMNAPMAATATADNGKVSNGNLYNRIDTSDVDTTVNGHLTLTNNGDVYQEAREPMVGRKLPDLPLGKPIHDSGTDTMTSREYAVPDLSRKVNTAMLHSHTNSNLMYQPDTPPPPYPSSSNDGAALPYGVYHGDDMQGLSGNSLYAVPNNLDLLWKEELSVMELPPENLHFVEKLGEGLFGEVHLCEAVGVAEYLEDGMLLDQMSASNSLLVAVKMLHSHADAKARDDFHKEIKIMSRLKDDNVVHVIGVCTLDKPLCVVVEYMSYGDLHQFLQRHLPAEATVSRRKNNSILSYGALVYMATQIASGMKYLESLNMVHRDLAARNCLVGANYTIKIADFGMSRSLYTCDYYRIEGKAVLPIRWMAWESLLLGKFSTKSDVWSFGATVWEVLTFARDQPFSELSDEAVIENCGHFYQNDHHECYLSQPANCPKEIYDLLLECWNREEKNRPSFLEIHMFLQRKNMGYDPMEEIRQNTLRPGVPVV